MDVKFRGRRMVVTCIDCGHEQIGYSKIDGDRCDKCGGTLEMERWLDEEPKTGTMLCSECEKLNIAMQLFKALSWRDSKVRFESILGFDNETGTILVDEAGLLKLIQLVTPVQEDRKIKLV
jgi:DNA-directed RNA polymerase subunit RPC12/RpoP